MNDKTSLLNDGVVQGRHIILCRNIIRRSLDNDFESQPLNIKFYQVISIMITLLNQLYPYGLVEVFMTNHADKKGRDGNASVPGKLPTGNKESAREKETKRDRNSK